MQIDSVEVFHAAFPLREAVAGPNGPLDRLETVFVKMTSGETAGWSEVAPGTAPTLGPEWVGSVYAVLREWMMPAVVGSTIDSADAFEERLAPFEGNRYAKAALDMAWWDLKARLEGKPLWKLLGGTKAAVAVGVEFDRNESIDDFLSDIGRAYAAGFSRVGLKFRPGWEIPMLSAVRRDYPTQTLHIDCVAGMRLRHMDTIHRVDDFGIDLMEQPLAADDLVGHAMIQESVRTPVCLDESVTTPEQAEMALELKSCKFMNLKPARVGGFTAARAIAEIAALHEVRVSMHTGVSPVGMMASANVSAAMPYAERLGIDRCHVRLAEAMLVEPPSFEQGFMLFGDRPGLGLEISEEFVNQYRRDIVET